MAVFEQLAQYHRSIRTTYEELSQQRMVTKTPLYFAEHGLDRVELENIEQSLRNALATHSLDYFLWQTAYIPLIAFATDMGYRYEGNGTDFWPTLELRLRYHFEADDRQRLSNWFAKCASDFGGVRPPNTDWAAAFHHIAWPITHAVLAKDIRGAFSESLRVFSGDVDVDDERLIQRFVRFRPPTWSQRYAAWLRNEKLVCALIRDLVADKSSSELGVLSEPFRNQLFIDLKEEPEFRRAVRTARRNLKRLPKRVAPTASSPSDTLTVIAGSLFLRRDESTGFELRGQLPQLPREVRRRLGSLFQSRRWRPRPWGFDGGAPISRGALTFGEQFTLPFSLVRRATNALPFFANIDDVGLDDGDKQLLNLIRLPSAERLAFLPPPQGEDLADLISTRPPNEGLIWVVASESNQPPPPTGDTLTRLDGGVVLQFDAAEPNVRQWLNWPLPKIETPNRSWSLRPITAPCVGNEPDFPTLLLSDPIIADVQCTDSGRTLLKRDGKLIAEHRGPGLLAVDCNSAGQYCVELHDEVGALERFDFQVIDTDHSDLDACSPCSLNLRGQVASHDSPITKRDLITGQLQLDIESPRSIQDIAVTLCLEPSGSVVKIRAERLPFRLGAGHAVWSRLIEQLTDHQLTDTCDLFLTVEAGELARQTWRIEADISELWWDLSGELPQALCESGQLALDARNAISYDVATLSQSPQEPLILSPLLDNGRSSLFDGLLLIAKNTAWPGTLERPKRLLRELDDHNNGLGLRAIVERYLSVAAASSVSKVAELHRRSISEQYRALLLETCCGEAWTRCAVEHANVESLDPFQLFWQSSVKNGAGIPKADVLPLKLETELLVLALPRLKQLLPQRWWDGPVPVINDDDAIRLDACFQELLPDSTVFTETVVWQTTLRQACWRFNGEHFAELIVPAVGGDELLESVILDSTLTELAEQLRDWIRRHLRAGRGRHTWSLDELSDWLSLLLAPEQLRKRPWEALLPKLLADRSVARAGAFIAWRQRQVARADCGPEIVTGERDNAYPA